MCFNACRFSIVVLFSVLLSGYANCQPTENVQSLEYYLAHYEKKENVKFFFRREWIKDIYPDPGLKDLPLNIFLKQALLGHPLQYVVYNKRKIVFFTAAYVQTQAPSLTDETFVADGRNYTVSGLVSDANSGGSIAGATVWIQEMNSGTVTDQFGRFSFTLRSARYTLEIRQIGKEIDSRILYLRKDTVLDLSLFDDHIQLSTVTISGESAMSLSSEMSIARMNSHTMKLMPPMLGEVDIIKSLTSLPGVSTVGEGAGGLNVRGGNSDQNLILLDDAPIFNSSHLFGFMSVFNPDQIKNVTLYKGSIPAYYGGRISSVLDIVTLDGNKNDVGLNGGIGTISSRLSVSVPLIKEKTSLIFGGRYAYPDWILHSIKDLKVKSSSATFYDANGKLTHQVNNKNSIAMSVNYSHDEFKFAEDTVYAWQSLSSSLRWSSIVAEKILMKNVLFYSDYQYGISGNKPTTQFDADFGIGTYGLKSDLSYSIDLDNLLSFGFSVNYYKNSPGDLKALDASAITPKSLEDEHGRESAVYLGIESRLSPMLTLTGGLRFSSYAFLGPDDVFIYASGSPRSEFSIVDSIRFGAGEPVKTYSGLEPRISGKISLNQTSSVMLSYNRSMQYLHLISNSTSINPSDLWQLSNYYLAPQIGNQFAVGYRRDVEKPGIETSAEFYYRTIDKVQDYRDGANLFMNPILETALLPASGIAYGAEWYLRKHTGRLTGWLSYTYSRSVRKIKTENEEEINNGKYYPANFDKPHNLSVLANYKLTHRISVSGNFNYNTGRPITYPSAVYLVNNKPIAHFAERNNARVPDYHRLDFSITLGESLRQTRRLKGSWTLSVMNVYARKNAYSIFFKPDASGRQIQANKLSVIGTIVPALTYNFKF